MPIALRAHDQRRAQVLTTGPIAHVDLLQLNGVPWLVRAIGQAGTIKVGLSYNMGASWADTTLATDGGVSGDGAAPTLAKTRWDDLLLWYHTTGGDSVGLRSTNGGASWDPYATRASAVYPRLVVQEHRQLLLIHDGDLSVYPSADYGETTETRLANLPGWPVQLAAARVDHRNIVHFITRSASDELEHSYTIGETAISSRVTLATGKYPALGLGIDSGLLLYFDGTDLEAHRLDESFGAVEATLADPAAYRPGYLGAWAASRSEWLTVGKVGGALRMHWAPGGYGTWEMPV